MVAAINCLLCPLVNVLDNYNGSNYSIQFNLLQILKLHMVLFTLEMNIHTVW